MMNAPIVNTVEGEGNPAVHFPIASGGRSSSRFVNLLSTAIIIACLFVLARILPFDRAFGALQSSIDQLGWLGPFAFGGAYVLAGLLFVPGSALTISSGALFGLLWGTVIVSVASTATAALAFLIARHFARAGVQRAARGNTRFGAIDRAIGTGGWKIVALLRLSPAVPFSLGNYLYGITSICFWPYVLSSWICMLPGTFMYVYIGHAGAQGLQAANGGGSAVGTGKTLLLVAGLVATVAVTAYVTRLSRRALAEQGAFEVKARSGALNAPIPEEQLPRATRRSIAAPLAAILLLAATGGAWTRRDALQGIFGPPVVKMEEAYGEGNNRVTFDHSTLDRLLADHVTEGGWVDYEGLRRDASRLDAYIAHVAKAPFDRLGRDEKLALLINAYNAFTLRLILDHDGLKSIKDIPDAKRWNDARWNLAGHVWSLNEIEQEQIRPKFKEPRIHFALVCAAVGCPPLRGEAYVGDRLEEQLEDQARYVHSHGTWFRFEPETRTAHLTPLFKWYGDDFKQTTGSATNFTATYSDSVRVVLKDGKSIRTKWGEYDWRLNSIQNRQDR
jgi:uncharacterized membrane protein YdjX (TVP38/TMEM64 family)